MTTLSRVNAAIAKASIPLELERGEGYQYFIFSNPAANQYETVSVYVCYLKDFSVSEWVNEAGLAHIEILERLKNYAELAA
jgi:hypothetical protein